MAKKKSPTPRIYENVLEDALALEETMTNAPEDQIEDRIRSLEEDTTKNDWEDEEKEYKELTKRRKHETN
ncbi:MAG: hypothetical protein J7K68_05670 [Candidatus Diapherotrites archaeon]|nr:hypothetical protein [Candidatus Diapherotrites archaeon]